MGILITGGLGYIGSHIAKICENKKVIIIDNKSNSKLNFREALPYAKVIVDDINIESLNKIFKENKIESVIHLAGYKSVNESMIDPLKYYKNNIQITFDLIETMKKYSVYKLIFSSSATVYGNNYKSPLKENLKPNPINPYGQSKLIIEKIIIDYCKANKDFSSIILRYFNPIGAHPSGDLNDNPLGNPQNLMPLIIKSLKGYSLKIFGSNYPTKDGTCVRDYIHVMDLADCHLKCLKYLKNKKGYEIFNVGLGKGISVLEIIKKFEKANKLKINFKKTKKRAGDASISFACNKKIKRKVGWKPKFGYIDMCKDSYRFSKNL